LFCWYLYLTSVPTPKRTVSVYQYFFFLWGKHLPIFINPSFSIHLKFKFLHPHSLSRAHSLLNEERRIKNVSLKSVSVRVTVSQILLPATWCIINFIQIPRWLLLKVCIHIHFLESIVHCHEVELYRYYGLIWLERLVFTVMFWSVTYLTGTLVFTFVPEDNHLTLKKKTLSSQSLSTSRWFI